MLLWQGHYMNMEGEIMKKLKKQVLACLTAALVLGAVQVTAFAAEDIVDESEIYLNEKVSTEMQQEVPVNTTVDGVSRNENSESSSAARTTDNDNNRNETTNNTNNTDNTGEIAPINEDENAGNMPNPNTGAPSMMLPIGIAMTALGCISALMKRREQ